MQQSITEEIRQNKLNGGAVLLAMAADEAKDPNNYKNKFFHYIHLF